MIDFIAAALPQTALRTLRDEILALYFTEALLQPREDFCDWREQVEVEREGRERGEGKQSFNTTEKTILFVVWGIFPQLSPDLRMLFLRCGCYQNLDYVWS